MSWPSDEISYEDARAVLARAVEEAVAAPILEYSPLLSGADLLEIVAP